MCHGFDLFINVKGWKLSEIDRFCKENDCTYNSEENIILLAEVYQIPEE